MAEFISPSGEESAKYECEAPHYELVTREVQLSRYQKNGDGYYRYHHGDIQKEASILCVGDMLCEEKLHHAHRMGERYCFHDIFSFVRPFFRRADLVIGNLETTVCTNAPFTGERYKIDGKYHCNAPLEFLDAVCYAGFDFLMLANNHNLDCGYQGILETLHHIDERGLMRTGLFAPGETQRFALVSVNGIRIGLLSYSTWYNRNLDRFTALGQRLLLNEYDPEKLKVDIAGARDAGAEFILVYMHWGINVEYKSVPHASMRRMAQEAADCGVDYIIGSHTHSLQPYEVITASDGRKVPCIFSMGNFVTSERAAISRETGFLQLCLKKQGGVVRITKEKFIPCYVPDIFCGIGYPIIPESSGVFRTVGHADLKPRYQHIREVIGSISSDDSFLTKKNICRVLGLPVPEGDDESYTSLSFPCDAEKGGAVIISDITSDPAYRTPESSYEQLAKIAMQKGASLLLAPKPIGDYPVLLTQDPFEAYCRLSEAFRKRFSPKTISITGSIGKTTTTEMVYTVMSSRFNTHRNTGSANNVRYAGRVIQKLREEHEIYVQETMEGPPFGAASTIAKMVRPQAAIVTVVGSSHLQAFRTQERILESCLGVQDGMPEDGILILNADDPFQHRARSLCTRKVVYYGIQEATADYRAVHIRGEGNVLCFDVLHDNRSTSVRIHCFGRHNVLNALAAFAAGKWAGMSDAEVTAGLAKYRTSGIRQNLVFYGGYRLFLDCYNSSLESVHSALDALADISIPVGGRRIAVLADIKEAGEQESEIHRKVGKLVLDSRADVLICYGECMCLTADIVREEKKIPVYYTHSSRELAVLLKEVVTINDVTLFKGSHSMALEQIVDQVWGTWFHEEFERYDFKMHTYSDADLSYQVYTDHAVVANKISTCETIIIPDYIQGVPVTGIGRSTFNQSKYTHSVCLPNYLVNIRYCAFYKANNIQSISIPSSIRVIDDSAFSTCENLEKVMIAEGCTHIGRRAFGNCKKLKAITIPSSVKHIGGEAFINCIELTIYGIKSSYAEQYARAHGIIFIAREDNASLSDC